MNSNMSTTMSVDLKKYRIRIHKATIHQLGDPKYIQYEILQAFLEIKNFSDFESLVDAYGSNWDMDVHLFKNWDWDDYGRDYYQTCNGEISSDMDNYFDFERYGEDVGYDTAHKYSEGIIVIYE